MLMMTRLSHDAIQHATAQQMVSTYLSFLPSSWHVNTILTAFSVAKSTPPPHLPQSPLSRAAAAAVYALMEMPFFRRPAHDQ